MVRMGGSMRPLARMASWLVVLLLGQATVAWACSCDTTTPAEAVASGDAVVVATIVGVSWPTLGCGGGAHRNVRIEITEVVAGPAKLGEMRIKTNDSSASCGLDLAKDEIWVLQLFESDNGTYASLCTAAQRIEGPDDAWLEALREAASAR